MATPRSRRVTGISRVARCASYPDATAERACSEAKSTSLQKAMSMSGDGSVHDCCCLERPVLVKRILDGETGLRNLLYTLCCILAARCTLSSAEQDMRQRHEERAAVMSSYIANTLLRQKWAESWVLIPHLLHVFVPHASRMQQFLHHASM